MIEVNVTEKMFLTAREKAVVGKLNNSILNGGGNLAGFIGEQIVLSVLGGEWINTYQYDLIIDGYKVDVKTKQTSVKPLPHYECSITENKFKIKIVTTTHSLGLKKILVLVGILVLEKREYFQQAKYLKKGKLILLTIILLEQVAIT